MSGLISFQCINSDKSCSGKLVVFYEVSNVVRYFGSQIIRHIHEQKGLATGSSCFTDLKFSSIQSYRIRVITSVNELMQ